MKVNLFILCAVFVSFSLNAQIYSISDIYNQTPEYINLIENKYHNQIIRLEYDITTGVSSTYRYLAKDNVYGIMAIGDKSKIIDLDLAIFQNKNGNWIKVVEDTTTEGLAVLNFTPSISDIYKMEIYAKFRAGVQYGFYSLMIFR